MTPTADSPSALFDPSRHEAVTATPWDEGAARESIRRIADAAQSAFDAGNGCWTPHPLDDEQTPPAHHHHLYWGAAGVIWALRHLAAQGAIELRIDFDATIAALPERAAAAAAQELHGSASYLFGHGGALLLRWKATGASASADALYEVVRGNLDNPTLEALWGSPGTLIAAIHMAEATGEARWVDLVREGVGGLLDQMIVDPETGTWVWEQDLYGRRSRMLGAGHGFVGNVYPAFRAAPMLDAETLSTVGQRALQTLQATALRDGDGLNWHPMIDAARVAGRIPLVHDCHGAPGVICRLSGAPRDAGWDALLRGAGELVWRAGPLATKGASLCHGTPGSAMACLKLWRRFGEEEWLHRGRALAMHSVELVERHRARYGMGRHSLWTGDLGVACLLWEALRGEARFPTLDVF